MIEGGVIELAPSDKNFWDDTQEGEIMTAKRGGYENLPPTSYQQGLFEESSTQRHKLGTIRVTEDGRRFAYCQAAATAIAAGAGGAILSKAHAPVDCTVAAADAALCVAGAKEISLTIAGATAGLYKDGWMTIKAGEGIGQMFKVAGNGATDGIASGRASISLYDKLQTTLVAASSTVGMWESPYSSAAISLACANAAAAWEYVVGVATFPITASYYFWAQTWGPCNLVLDVDAAAGAELNEAMLVLGTTAGRAMAIAAAADVGAQTIGYPFEAADLTDAEGNLCMLTIS